MLQKNQEGIIQTTPGGVNYIFYLQKGGDMVRVDVLNFKKLKNIDIFEDYIIVDSSESYLTISDRTTYYLKPSNHTEQKFELINSTHLDTIEDDLHTQNEAETINNPTNNTVTQVEKEIEHVEKLLIESILKLENAIKDYNQEAISYYEYKVYSYNEELKKFKNTQDNNLNINKEQNNIKLPLNYLEKEIIRKEKHLSSFKTKLSNAKKVNDRNSINESEFFIDIIEKNLHDLKTNPKYNKLYYTDSLGQIYKTISIHVYLDSNGNYRSFADSTKARLDSVKEQLASSQKDLKEAKKLKDTEKIDFYTKEVEMYKNAVKEVENKLSKM